MVIAVVGFADAFFKMRFIDSFLCFILLSML